MLDLCLADNRDLYFWKVLESIQNFIIDLHVLQCLFASGSNKKQRRGRIISNVTKGQTFWSLMTTKCSWGKEVEWVNLKILSPSLHHTECLPLPFNLAEKRIYLETLLKGEVTDLFWRLLGCSLFSRVGIGWWALYNS